MGLDHASLDTYAKKLYITRKFDVLIQLKLIISAYFIFEQSSETDEPQIYVKHLSQYSSNPIDPRYDFFMAALLKAQLDSPILPENLRIVSWNYDSQIELAFHPYSQISHDDDESLRKQLNLFPSFNYDYSYDRRDDLTNIQIVKLNGTATNYYAENNRLSKIKSNRRLFLKDAMEQISDLIEIAIKSINASEYSVEGVNINFAWELTENWFSKKKVEKAKELISSTTTLVIIGYSFPVFNREIDRYLFQDSSIEKIYLQDHADSIEGVKSRAKNILNLQTEDRFELETNLEQFLIPFEL